MEPVYIIDTVRTPIGKYGGILSSVRPDDLLALVIRAVVDRNPSIDVSAIEDVIAGAANQSGEDNRNVARMAALLAGLPITIPGTTVNRLCASGLQAIMDSARTIACGDAQLMIACGVESMSRAPFVMPKASTPFERTPHIYDTTMGWRFVNPKLSQLYHPFAMGETAENVAKQWNISRHAQDEFAIESQQKYAAALKAEKWNDEIIPVEIKDRQGNVTLFSADEGVRPEISRETLSKLKPVFSSSGTITAGSASQISDGGAAVVVMSKEKALELGIEWLCEIGAHGMVAGPDAGLHEQPANAIKEAARKEGIGVEQFDFIEINEAFAAIGIVSSKALGINLSTVNIHGGAIAVGHPLGMSGARLALHIALQLKAKGSGYGVAALCGGGGQGDALIFRR